MRKLKLILIFLNLVVLGAFAQETSISPFTRIGIGDPQEGSFAQNFAMGGLAYGMQSPFNINPYNPASYSKLFWTGFEASVISQNIWLKSGQQAQRANVSNFDHLALGLPVAPWWGVVLGIMPVSKVGYDYKTAYRYNAVDGTEVTYNNTFQGQGGLNRIMLGHGFSVKRTFFFGFNMSYYFGKMEYQETIDFTLDDNFNNSARLETIEAGDLYFDFGVQYRTNLGGKWRLDMGAVLVPLQGLSSKRSEFSFTYNDINGTQQIIDTVNFAENESFSIVLPPKYGIGFVMNRNDRFRVGIDLDYTLWSESNYNTYGGLKNTFGIKTGTEIMGRNERMIYRLGARYGALPIVLDGSRSNVMAVSAGVGIPIRSKDKLNYTVLNIGLEAGQRGKTEGNWIRENFINVNVALTLNNKWFIKRVYD